MAHINYLTMNFEDLFHAVFDDFGDKAVGRLNQKAAYEAAYKYLYK